ncbi:MAG: OB-fold nucleic acid binding domain-containing protein [Actinobacteria bacterium]|uniref:OB-fold nucleic acid binding domain-containing protein n=1 Tax=Propionicimonas sp. T2.31MG-18 TaxID=3157620 RepID=UPI0035E600D5|nr:OB-fold nucleic acid binding domain-containing protein [Actinomycetota bacterium]
MASTNPLLRALRRFGASNEELESEARQKIVESAGAIRISELRDRQWARLRGRVTVLTMKPRSGTPWLEAEFDDGSGTVTIVWMGRRAIPGVTAGRELTVSGRVSYVDGQRRLYNPYYELIA